MLASSMATSKKPPQKPRTPKPEGRKKSKLTQAGDAAKLEAERVLLLRTLKTNAWNLSATARELEMGDASSVLRAIRDCGLEPEYDKHRA